MKVREILASAYGIIRKGTHRGTKTFKSPTADPHLLGVGFDDERRAIALATTGDAAEVAAEEEDDEGIWECTLAPVFAAVWSPEKPDAETGNKRYRVLSILIKISKHSISTCENNF